MAKQANSSSKKSGLGLKQIFLFIIGIFILFLIWNLFKIGLSIHQNRKIYDVVINFTPTENSYIQIVRTEEEQPGAEYLPTEITLSSVEAQQAAMDIISELEYGGFYFFSNSLIPVEEWKAISVYNQKGHFYDISLYPEGQRVAIADIQIGSKQAFDIFSEYYDLKYDNWEPVRTYLDQFWAENTPANGAIF